jgi:hypothetical protein
MSAIDTLEDRVRPMLPRDGAGGAALAMILVAVPTTKAAPIWITIAVALVAAVAVALPTVRRHPGMWLGIGLVHAWFLVTNWYRLDNHDFLILYGILALVVAFLASDPEASLRTQARWLLGLAFALATGWKVFGGEFVDGSFFTHALLVDPRFARVAEWAAGVDPAVLDSAAANVRSIAIEPVTPAVQIPTAQVSGLAVVLSGWGIALEATIAVAMLAPDRPRWHAIRSVSLLVFMATTYLVVPVVRFGLLLAALGIAQSVGRWRHAFWWSIPALLAWGPIWQTLQP